MPSLHHQYHGEATQPDGSTARVPPVQVLAFKGPWVDVTISVSDSLANHIPEDQQISVSGRALIDSGATSSCIDVGVATQLELNPIDVVQMASASHAAVDANIYPVKIFINGLSTAIDLPRAMGAQLGNQDLIALLGRDLLAHCTMFYNGPRGQITLSL